MILHPKVNFLFIKKELFLDKGSEFERVNSRNLSSVLKSPTL